MYYTVATGYLQHFIRISPQVNKKYYDQLYTNTTDKHRDSDISLVPLVSDYINWLVLSWE